MASIWLHISHLGLTKMFFKERMPASMPKDVDFSHLGWGLRTEFLQSSPGDGLSQG